MLQVKFDFGLTVFYLCLVGLGVNQLRLNQINLKSNLTCNIKFISKGKKDCLIIIVYNFIMVYIYVLFYIKIFQSHLLF